MVIRGYGYPHGTSESVPLRESEVSDVRNKSLPYAITLVISILACQVGCAVQADHYKESAISASNQSAALQIESPAHTVRFVAETSKPPGLFSGGSYIDEQHAWVAAGFDVKRTIDGGRSWQLMRLSAESESVIGKLGEIYHLPAFITPRRGWLNISKGLWQTEDAGMTWQQSFAEDTNNPTFADAQHGWIVTYEGEYQQNHVTKDGGLTWQRCGSKLGLNQQTPDNAFFLTPKDGWAITNHTDDKGAVTYGVARTSDSGCSWQQLWTEDQDQRYCGIYFLNEREGWLTGCYSTGQLVQTKDGGRTWRKVHTPVEPWRASPIDVFFSNFREGWLITRATTDGVEDGMYKTADGGRSWRHLSSSEILEGFEQSPTANQVPIAWKAGRLFQMLLFSSSQQPEVSR